uniref:Ubiquitin-conjugating enzyme E2 Z n=1 Tax=Cyanistes caeruleus TaxID=156563 RepID=A0A8C0VIT4_CYACU
MPRLLLELPQNPPGAGTAPPKSRFQSSALQGFVPGAVPGRSRLIPVAFSRDIMSIYKEPPPGMFVVPDPHDMTKIHALITGPFDTPYEGGFFLFLFRCPPDYPIHPPRVKLMTTGNNTVRFNPNFYRNGKVCLSILGTWTGPAWSPAQSISSVLISIQSLMTENPYHNEPGFEQERHPGDSKNYNECIRHETIRVAVCDMLEGKCPCPEPLRYGIPKIPGLGGTRSRFPTGIPEIPGLGGTRSRFPTGIPKILGLGGTRSRFPTGIPEIPGLGG